jgi:hypothetical protein
MKNITRFIQVLLLSTAACSAATIQIVFDSPNQSASPGSTIAYSANLFNLTAADIDLGSALVSLGGSLTVDPFPFLDGPAVLAANGSTGSFEIFTVSIPYVTPAGSVFPGILSITDLGDNVLAEAPFSAAISVPEPSPTVLVFFSSLLCLGAAIRRPRARPSSEIGSASNDLV